MKLTTEGLVPRLALVATVALLWLAGCGGGGTASSSNTSGSSAQNVQGISVNSGPTGQLANGVFTSVTVCVPGTSNCQTISDVLVDTGSSGLRILNTAIQLSLPAENAPNGNPMVECTQFADGFAWGPVKTADIKISSEQASSVPMQVIDPNSFAIPAACSNTGTNLSTLAKLLANGILGVGLGKRDCGSPCTTTGTAFYWACSAPSTCQETGVPLAQQVQNPVWLFPTDNNGVVVHLPSIGAAALSASGSLIFGIGTQSNNGLGSATILTVDSRGSITTIFAKDNSSHPGSFIDSGSNAIFFLDQTATGMPPCPGGSSAFYCPASTQTFMATNQGTNGATSTVTFSVANAQTLFSNAADNAFSQLAGPNPGIFDWGVPFFYGRTVFTAIEGQSTPGGPGPYLAY